MAVSLRQVAYDYIKAKIVSCQYAPNEFINEGMVIDAIKVSRTPVREALRQLEHEGLVRILPKKGVMVTDVSIGDINSVYEARILIEPYILRTWVADVDVEVMLSLRRKFEARHDASELFDLDDTLHGAIYNACPNRYLVQALTEGYVMNMRLHVLAGSLPERQEQSNAEHGQIIDAILNRDGEAAAVAMTNHLTNARTAAFEQFFRRSEVR